MSRSEIVYQRLSNQRLSFSEFRRPVDVVHWLGAVQAQDFSGAKWALAQRMRDTTDADIEQAYNEGQILRTHLMRPTWHFVAPDDIRWLLQLTAPRVNIACGTNYRKFELDDGTFKRCNKILTSALKGGRYLTRASLRKILNDSGIAAHDSVRLAHILLRAELDAVICSGPMVGKQFTYALLEERVTQTKPLDREQALAKLTQRYFTSHGPATLRDFMWWSGLTAADAKKGVALVERQLTKMIHEDQLFWSVSADTVQISTKSSHLLSAYDEYIVAYKDRKAIVGRKNVNVSRKVNGLMGPAVIVNGSVIGTWKRMNAKRAVRIEVKALRPLTQSETVAIKKAADRYAKFLGASVADNVVTSS
jgi:Winged helix DNA-binding domain